MLGWTDGPGVLAQNRNVSQIQNCLLLASLTIVVLTEPATSVVGVYQGVAMQLLRCCYVIVMVFRAVARMFWVVFRMFWMVSRMFWMVFRMFWVVFTMFWLFSRMFWAVARVF